MGQSWINADATEQNKKPVAVDAQTHAKNIAPFAIMSRVKRCSAARPHGFNMEPCTQAADIAVVKEQVANSRKELLATRLMLEKMSTTLEHIAEQRVEIQHMKEDAARNENDINELFDRMRMVELSPGRTAGKLFWLLVSVTVSGIAGLISTVVTWLIMQ